MSPTEPPFRYKDMLELVTNNALKQKAIGKPENGGLVQGKVYTVKDGYSGHITVWRLWNSNNPCSKLGKWWTFDKPTGDISNFRKTYAVCHEWSPLDRLVKATLKAGAQIVLGPGQSAKCSKYVKYKQSDTQQVFISDPQNAFATITDMGNAQFKFGNSSTKDKILAVFQQTAGKKLATCSKDKSCTLKNGKRTCPDHTVQTVGTTDTCAQLRA